MKKIIGRIRGQNILFLQGPLGSFFKKLDSYFRANGAKTYRICLNAGDQFFSHKDNIVGYTGTMEDWASFFRQVLIEYHIDRVFLFGDCRFYQRVALKEAEDRRDRLFCFRGGIHTAGFHLP